MSKKLQPHCLSDWPILYFEQGPGVRGRRLFWFFRMMTAEKESDSSKLAEGVDYYWENGLMVFTEVYHLKRGYCCASGCRHCPYEQKDRAPDAPV